MGRAEGFEEGMEKGMMKGIEKGIEKGREEGRLEALLQTAKNFLALGIPISDVTKATELSEEPISAIQL